MIDKTLVVSLCVCLQVLIAFAGSLAIFDTDCRIRHVMEDREKAHRAIEKVVSLRAMIEKARYTLRLYRVSQDPASRSASELDYEKTMSSLTLDVGELMKMESRNVSDQCLIDSQKKLGYLRECFKLLTPARFYEWDHKKEWRCYLGSPYLSFRQLMDMFEDELKLVSTREQRSVESYDQTCRVLAASKLNWLYGMPAASLVCALSLCFAMRRVRNEASLSLAL